MLKKTIIISICLLCFLGGCGKKEKNSIENIETEFTNNIGENDELQNEEVIKDTPVIVNDSESMCELLKNSIKQCQQPPIMDVTDFPLEYGLELDVMNIFSAVLSENDDFDYAYNITPETNEQGFLICKIDYMPYRTGNYPEEFEGIEVDSLTEIINVAKTHLDKDSVNIKITNPELRVSDINAVLGNQVGQTYIFCRLNEDGTQIIIEPSTLLKGEPIHDKTEALQKLSRISELAQQVVDEYTNENMSQLEKAQTLYAYLVDNVVYDVRYYTDIENFNDKGRTALGALEDHLAICGGYSQALQSLFEKVGISTYIEAGFAGEDHIWTIAKIDNDWKLFDATFDAGKPQDKWQYFNVDIESISDHIPQNDVMGKLITESENR